MSAKFLSGAAHFKNRCSKAVQLYILKEKARQQSLLFPVHEQIPGLLLLAISPGQGKGVRERL